MTKDTDSDYFQQKAVSFLAHALVYGSAWRNGSKAIALEKAYAPDVMAHAKFHIPLGDLRMLISNPENGHMYCREDTLPDPETIADLLEKRLVEYGLQDPKITITSQAGKSLVMKCEVPANNLHLCYLKEEAGRGKGR